MKTKAKARKIEKRTVFVFQDGENVAIRKRPAKGLLAGLYELPNIEGELSADEALGFQNRRSMAMYFVWFRGSRQAMMTL